MYGIPRSVSCFTFCSIEQGLRDNCRILPFNHRFVQGQMNSLSAALHTVIAPLVFVCPFFGAWQLEFLERKETRSEEDRVCLGPLDILKQRQFSERKNYVAWNKRENESRNRRLFPAGTNLILRHQQEGRASGMTPGRPSGSLLAVWTKVFVQASRLFDR